MHTTSLLRAKLSEPQIKNVKITNFLIKRKTITKMARPQIRNSFLFQSQIEKRKLYFLIITFNFQYITQDARI
jgi:hypothetical protein